MPYHLPKPYLSYSAFALWLRDKDQYRRRYYEGEPAFETVETIFGKTVHEHLEKTRLGREKRIEITLECGLKLLGFIDEFHEPTLSIRDDKTGHLDKDGKMPWDRVKVQKHKQLVFYSLLVYLKYGDYNPKVELRWIETRFKKDTRTVMGHEVTAPTRELELTGSETVFIRKVFKYEMENLKKEIIRVANEISSDYILWQQKRNLQTKS